ncbi:MAG: cytochrome c5 family protein [Gammaproteobacteria bacterium]|jgi:cytochrome c5
MAGLALLAVVLIFTAISLTSDVSEYEPEEIVLENIKPVGEVYVAGESEPEQVADTSTDAAGSGPMSGEEVYNANCMACHGTGAAGAPKIGDAAAWAPRIAKGMDTLMSNAVNGLNAMPPKGLCMACSDEELRAAIEYMVGKSQ